MAAHQTHVGGLIPCARNGHGLETTPIAVNYADGRSAYITLRPKKLAGGDHVVPAIAREMGEIPPARFKGVKRVKGSARWNAAGLKRHAR